MLAAAAAAIGEIIHPAPLLTSMNNLMKAERSVTSPMPSCRRECFEESVELKKLTLTPPCPRTCPTYEAIKSLGASF